MNEITLRRLARQAILLGPMVVHYPDPSNPKVTFPPSPYYRFLRLLATNAKLSVELGVCGGGGSLHLAMSSRKVVGVDIARDYDDNLNYIENKYPNFHFMLGDSVVLSSHIYTTFGLIDVLFIDTTHTYEQTMAEYYAYEPYLNYTACVCLDDLFRPGMDRAWDEMPDNKVRLDFLHPSQSPTDGGFGVVWK